MKKPDVIKFFEGSPKEHAIFELKPEEINQYKLIGTATGPSIAFCLSLAVKYKGENFLKTVDAYFINPGARFMASIQKSLEKTSVRSEYLSISFYSKKAMKQETTAGNKSSFPNFYLVEIDLLDSYPDADVFNEEKYKILVSGPDLKVITQSAVEQFKERNGIGSESYDDWFSSAEDKGYEHVITNEKGSEILRASMVLYDKIVEKALKLSLKHHSKTPLRKGDGRPYLEHPLAVAHLLARNRNFENEEKATLVAAALCHDLLEDSECTPQEIAEACGSEVLRIVQAVTNDHQLEDLKDWEKKKERYIETVKTGGEKAIAVSIADKIANLQSFLDQFEIEGPAMWKKFNRGKAEKVWFEKAVFQMAKENWKHPLIDWYEEYIRKFEALPD